MSIRRLPGAALLALAMLTASFTACSSASWPTAPVHATEPFALDPAQGQLSEGLALRDGSAYVGFSANGEVAKVDIATGRAAAWSSLPTPVAGTGFLSGLAFHGDDLYGALVSFNPSVQPGIYRITSPGQPATLFARDAGMVFPNGLLFDDDGRLWVTDSAAGAIFRIDPSGAVSKWASDPLLAGNKDYCGAGRGVGVPFDIGVNGLVRKGDALYVTNTDQASVVRIPIAADGSAGVAARFAGPDCAQLSGADGLVVAPDGDLIVASNHLNLLARVDGAGRVTTLLAGAPLDFPTSLVFDGATLYVGNFAFLDTKNPGLLSIR
jgi:hypothetical protein